MTKLFEARYYETYFVANAINNVLVEPFSYLHNLDDFYGELLYVRFLKPYQKHSSFHQFIEFVVDSLFYEALDERLEKSDELNELPINLALRHYKITHQSFSEWLNSNSKESKNIDSDAAYSYYSYLKEYDIYNSLLKTIVEEVFFIMFLNRHSLMLFHKLIADVITSSEIEELKPNDRVWFSNNGILLRKNIPQWAKNAVFYRDRGRCVLCYMDLSHLLSLQNENHFDHIVPLARGGINDVTNLQLLCSDCNYHKSAKDAYTSVMYEKWY